MWTGPLSEIASAIEVTIFSILYTYFFNQRNRDPQSRRAFQQQLQTFRRISSIKPDNVQAF